VGSVLSARTGTVSRPARLGPAKRDGPHLGSRRRGNVPRSTYTSEGVRRHTSRKTTPTCSKVCAGRGGRDDCEPTSRRGPCHRCGGVFAAKRCAASSSIRKSANIIASSPRPLATACWWNLRASSVGCAAAVQQAMPGRNTGVAVASAARGDGSGRKHC
jgi:hypothetical protein